MLGILSDAHGNGPAFELAVERLARAGVQRFMFLGDAIGYIPSASVVRLLTEMKSDVTCIRGNHEEMLLGGELPAKREHVYQLNRTRQLLAGTDLEFLASWPTSRTLSLPIGEVLFVHGSPADPTNGYVYPDSDLTGFKTGASFVFMGHSHYPFMRRQGTTLFVNVGSCGLPRDDGRFGAAALFDEATGAVRLLRFDITRETAAALEQAGEVHASVAAVFDRRKEQVTGEFDGE